MDDVRFRSSLLSAVNGALDTPLHSAASAGHPEAVETIIRLARANVAEDTLRGILFGKNDAGDTALHLAARHGHRAVVERLVKLAPELAAETDGAGVSALYLAVISRTPADLIEDATGFYSMVRLVVKLYVSGAQVRPERQDHIEKWKGQDIMKWRESTSKKLAIVSTLLATVAFSAAFNVLGSYGSDGKANLGGDHLHNAFLVLDTIAVTNSVVATILLIYGRASWSHRSWIGFMISMHFLWLALDSMMLAFFAAIVAVMSKKNPMKIALSQLIYYGLYILMTLLASLATPGSLTGVMRFLVGGFYEQQRRAKRRISRQFPFVMFYAFNVVVFIVINTISLAAIDVSGRLTW
ncbi:hypothetical protein ACQ4PT_053003 [Festuca glaucescens]